MLNCPSAIPSFFNEIWTEDSFRVCADGAANRLFDYSRDKEVPLPDMVIGDFDSARKDVLAYYESQRVPVIKKSDQDSTDFQKALFHDAVIDARIHRGGSTAVLGGLGGFFSHIVANLSSCLNACKDIYPPLFFLGENDLCFVVRPGLTTLKSPLKLHCSLVPLFGHVENVSTSGLKWDLKGDKMSFGELVSTSNLVVSDEIKIETTNFMLFIFDKRK